MNVEGVIVGNYFDSAFCQPRFILSRGNYTTVDDPASAGTVLSCINDLNGLSGFHCPDPAPATAAQKWFCCPEER